MATLTITVPNDKVDRILAAFDYKPEMGDKSKFIQNEIINIIKSKVAMSELSKIERVEPVVDVSNLNLS